MGGSIGNSTHVAHNLWRMTSHELLATLRERCYIMLRPSPIAGIGVFAIADIPRGCREMFGPPDPASAWVTVTRADVEALPEPARMLVETYCLYDDKHYFVPAHGFTKMDLALYLNHSDTPNVVSVEDGQYFEAVRDIAVGEELTVDYGAMVSEDDSIAE
jgi:hypothetical protein